MSDLEGQAKPILVSLFSGDQFTLEVDAQSILARWIAKTTVVADTIYPEMSATSQSERTLVMTTGAAPENWHIWLAQHSNAEWIAGLVHIGKAVHPATDYERLKNSLNTQSTTIGIGKLLIHVFSSAVPGVRFDPSAEFGPRLRHLWPPPPKRIFWPAPQRKILWPPFHSLSDEEVVRLARYLFYTRYTPSPPLSGR